MDEYEKIYPSNMIAMMDQEKVDVELSKIMQRYVNEAKPEEANGKPGNPEFKS
jgi:hypothetical protein